VGYRQSDDTLFSRARTVTKEKNATTWPFKETTATLFGFRPAMRHSKLNMTRTTANQRLFAVLTCHFFAISPSSMRSISWQSSIRQTRHNITCSFVCPSDHHISLIAFFPSVVRRSLNYGGQKTNSFMRSISWLNHSCRYGLPYLSAFSVSLHFSLLSKSSHDCRKCLKFRASLTRDQSSFLSESEM
jgi:hypothetical protein